MPATQSITGFSSIAVELQKSAATITLNHPPQNVIDFPMMGDLRAALEQLELRPEISVIVITGNEKAFSAGVDVAAHLPGKVQSMLAEFHGVIHQLVSTAKVTIACVRGNCYGGGAELALMCDMVFAADSSSWGFPEIQLACFPPVACVALSAAVGQKRAAELVLTGRLFNGLEAQQMGLANAAVPEAGLARILQDSLDRISKLSPAALAMAKKALYAWDAIHFEKGLARAEQIYLNELMPTEDAREGIAAWLEKRRPVWKGK